MMDLPLYPDGYAPRPPGEVEFETGGGCFCTWW
jgi:hypothetical protein